MRKNTGKASAQGPRLSLRVGSPGPAQPHAHSLALALAREADSKGTLLALRFDWDSICVALADLCGLEISVVSCFTSYGCLMAAECILRLKTST